MTNLTSMYICYSADDYNVFFCNFCEYSLPLWQNSISEQMNGFAVIISLSPLNIITISVRFYSGVRQNMKDYFHK